jgi:hypothetical protein
MIQNRLLAIFFCFIDFCFVCFQQVTDNQIFIVVNIKVIV